MNTLCQAFREQLVVALERRPARPPRVGSAALGELGWHEHLLACGACRQVLFEFGPDATIVWANLGGARQESTMRALLPGAFDASQLPDPAPVGAASTRG